MQMTLLRVVRSSFILNLFISLAVFAASGIVNPAVGQTTVLFDFETAPDSDAGDGIDPVFIDPVSGFTLSHDPGPVYGNAQWADDGGKCSPRTVPGCMRLSDDGTGPVAVAATINFSRPVGSVTVWVATFTVTATITPILAPGSTSPAPAAISVSASGGTYSKLDIVGGGPYIGLELAAPLPNQLQWDDLEVAPTLIEADWKATGDGLITRDTVTGLEWLDLTETTNLSVGDVSAQFGPGGDFEGFRYATATEVGQFYTDAGLSGFATDPNTVFGNSNATQIALAEALQAFWGITRSDSAPDRVRSSCFFDELLRGSVYRLTTLHVQTESPQKWSAGTRASTAGSALPFVGSALVRSSGEISSTTARDIPTPTGVNVPVITIDAFQQVAAEVIVAGTTDADFCVAPDIREIVQRNGKKRYISRPLALAELSGLGSCTGPLVPEETDTWEDLLSQIDLEIAPWYRSYEGDFGTESGYWFVIGVVRTSAEYKGPVAVVGFPEFLIDFAEFIGEPDCDSTLDMRPLDLGGAVDAFGEVPNVEGNRMIVETAQCNRSSGLTRRTTHVYPVRLDGNANIERINVQWQLNGIEDTLAEAGACIIDTSPITDMLAELDGAREAFAEGRFDDAIGDLEEIARIAKDADFTSCPITANYSGNFMSRALAAAFAVHDRFLHADVFEKYFIPADLEVPVLDPTTP